MVAGGDKMSDVALLKIEAEGLQTAAIAQSGDVAVGEEVVAIGNPLGELTFTMTHGYISATDREINVDGTPINMMQTDAAINSGNSGGPLFDMNGNVIGITAAKYSGQTASGTTIEGIGFCNSDRRCAAHCLRSAKVRLCDGPRLSRRDCARS